jgi:uncharacterized protein YhfF
VDLPNSSVLNLWNRFTRQHRQYKNSSIPNHFYFCDNEHDANTCAELVVQNIKQATAPSIWWYEYHNEPMPKAWHFIYRNRIGMVRQKPLLKVTELEQIRFKDVGEAFAYTEGEGDRSLAYWRKVHRAYYTREMEKAGARFNENMLISCEYFKLNILLNSYYSTVTDFAKFRG